MKNTHKKLTAFALLASFALAAPAFADTTPSDVASDVGAVQKDNAAIAKDNAKIARDRANKAQDKATGNWTDQAADSVSIGADQTMKAEKETEKSTDKKIMNHDANNLTSQSSSSQ